MAISENSDEDLVRRLRAGDDTAGRFLFDRHLASLHALLRRRIAPALRRKFGESDIIQSAYVAVIESIETFVDRGPGSFRRWLSGILDHKLRDEIRRFHGSGKRALAREVRLDSKLAGREPIAIGETPSAMAAAGEERSRVRRAVETLSPDFRTVIRLVHKEGLSLVQAASHMGRSPDAVRKLYGRAVAKLASVCQMAPARRRSSEPARRAKATDRNPVKGES